MPLTRQCCAIGVVLMLSVIGSVADAAPSTVAIHKVLTVLVEVQGHRPLWATRDQVVQALFGHRDSVSTRFRKMSYGQVDFRGSIEDVAGPFSIAEPEGDFCRAGYLRLADAADAAARKSGVDVGRYDHFLYVIPPDMPCAWVGVGIIGGHRVWAKAATVRLFQHELGHNLGLNHALFWSKPAAEGSDLMGDASMGLNAPHLMQLDWLGAFPGKRLDVSGAQTLTLETLETDPTASGLPKVAVVEPSGSANTYYLSYRAPPGTKLDRQYARGVNIHIFNNAREGSPNTYFVKALSDGESYEDGPLIIRQLSHTTGRQVRIRIEFTGHGIAMQRGPPPAPPGSLQSVATGLCLDVSRGSRADGGAVIQYGCHGGENQQWALDHQSGDLVRIVNGRSGKCIAVRSGEVVTGAPLVQWTCSGTTDQMWKLLGTGDNRAIEAVGSALCVDVPRGSHESGLQVALWRCSGATNQQWKLSGSTPLVSDGL